jgi:hypothetical protein
MQVAMGRVGVCGSHCDAIRHHLLGRAAVGLPGKGGRDTNARRYQEAGEAARGSPAERGPVGRQRVIIDPVLSAPHPPGSIGPLWCDQSKAAGR